MNKTLLPWLRRYFSHPEAMTLTLLLLLGTVIVKTMGEVVAPILTSLIIAYMLTAVVKRFESWRCPRLLAVMVVFILFLGILLFMLFWLLPLLWGEVSNLFMALPSMVKRGQQIVLQLQARYPLIAAVISPHQLQETSGNWSSYLANLSKLIWSFSLASLNGFVALVVYLVLVPLLVFFFLKDSRVISDWFVRFLPHKRSTLQTIWREINYKIGSYIKGKMVEMLIVFLVTTLVFAILGVPYTALLSALVGLSVFIPYIGIVVATVPIVIVALLEWGWSAQFLHLMIAYIAIVTLDANVLVPMLFAEAMNLHPIAIILAVLVFGSLGGFWWVFFAIPLVALIHVIVRLWPIDPSN